MGQGQTVWKRLCQNHVLMGQKGKGHLCPGPCRSVPMGQH